MCGGSLLPLDDGVLDAEEAAYDDAVEGARAGEECPGGFSREVEWRF